MTPDSLKKFIVKIHSATEGSGVIFKPEKNSQYAYVFSAKHVFFEEKNADEAYKKTSLTIDSIKIIIEEDKKEVKILNNTIYFLDFIGDKSVDFAFAIVDLFSNNLEDDILPLELEDSYDEEYDISEQVFYIYGYPKSSKGNKNTSRPYRVKYTQRTDVDEYFYQEEFRDVENNIDIDQGIGDEVSGLSGSGVFLLNEHVIKLRSIFIESTNHNVFICVKLNNIIDEVNIKLNEMFDENHKKLQLQEVQCGNKIIIEKNELNFSEYSDFSHFKKSIEKDKNFNDFCKEKDISFDNKNISKKLKKKLQIERKELYKKTEAMSFVYAKLAILSHENGNRYATTRYFKQAIKLNEKHKQALLLEKDLRDNDVENIIKKNIQTESLEERVSSLIKALDKNINNKIKEDITNKIISDFNYYSSKSINEYNNEKYFHENKEYFHENVSYHIKRLENIIENNVSIRVHYRYRKIAIFLLSFDNLIIKSYSFHFFIICKEIVESLSKTTENKEFINSIYENISLLEKDDVSCKSKKDAIIKAKNILLKKEEYFNFKTKEVIFNIYDKTSLITKENKELKHSFSNMEKEIDEIKTINYEAGYNLIEISTEIEKIQPAIDQKIDDISSENKHIQKNINDSLEYFDEGISSINNRTIRIKEELACNYDKVLKNMKNEANVIKEKNANNFASIHSDLTNIKEKIDNFKPVFDEGLNKSISSLNSDIKYYLNKKLTSEFDILSSFSEKELSFINNSLDDIKTNISEIHTSLKSINRNNNEYSTIGKLIITTENNIKKKLKIFYEKLNFEIKNTNIDLDKIKRNSFDLSIQLFNIKNNLISIGKEEHEETRRKIVSSSYFINKHTTNIGDLLYKEEPLTDWFLFDVLLILFSIIIIILGFYLYSDIYPWFK